MFCVFGKFFAGFFLLLLLFSKKQHCMEILPPSPPLDRKVDCLESSLLLCQVQPVSAAQYHHPSPPSPFPSSSIIVPILYHYCATIFSLKTWKKSASIKKSSLNLFSFKIPLVGGYFYHQLCTKKPSSLTDSCIHPLNNPTSMQTSVLLFCRNPQGGLFNL